MLTSRTVATGMVGKRIVVANPNIVSGNNIERSN